MKVISKVVYSNDLKFEAGFTEKKDGCPRKKDTLVLRITMPDGMESQTYFMRPDEMLAIAMVCLETLWEAMK